MAHITIPSTEPRMAYAATGGTAFAIPFPFFATADVKVYLDGTLQASGYTITGTAVDGGYTSGTCTFTTAPPTGTTVTLVRDIAINRTTDFPYPSRALDIEGVNTEFDRAFAVMRDARRFIAQTLRAPAHEGAIAELPELADRIGPAPAEWDADGNLIRGGVNVTSAGYETGWLDVIAAGYVVADNTTDDTTGWRNAAATGRPLYFSGGTSLVTGKVDLDAAGQKLLGHAERSVIRGVGNFDTFEWGGGTQGGGIDGITFSSAGKTGGTDFAVRNHLRFDHGWTRHSSPFTAIEVAKTNIADFGTIIIDGYRGDRGMYCVGTAADPCYIVRIDRFSAAPSTTANKPALECNGTVATLDLNVFEVNGAPGATDMQYGVWVHNGIGAATTMQFFFCTLMQVDYAVTHGARFDVGVFIGILSLYAQGCKNGSGVYLGSAVNRVAIGMPMIQGNAEHGIYTEADDLSIGPGWIVFNSLEKLGYFDGVHCASGSERTSIVGTRIGTVEGAGGTHRYGLYGASGAVKISMSGGSLSDNLRGAYRDDTGVGTADNFNVSGVEGVGHTWDGHTTLGSTAGFGADASITISGGVIQPTVTVTAAGNHYDVAPTVFAFDPAATGSGATFTATVANGKVTAITRTAGGSSYGTDTFLIIVAAEAPPALRTRVPGTANQNLAVRGQGTGGVLLGGERGVALAAVPAADSVNYVQASGVATGGVPSVGAVGSDTNIDLLLTGKGTGVVRVGTWTSNADAAVNGYVTIKDSSGNTRKLATIA